MELGIDEAGRGAIIGSLFMAGVLINPIDEAYFKKIGVADSKSFGSGNRAVLMRAKLAKLIEQECAFKIVSASQAEVDKAVYRGELNVLERKLAASLLHALPNYQEAVLDGLSIFKELTINNPRIIAKNKADSSHISVAAASILAKNKRDLEVENYFDSLLPQYNSFKSKGMGYPNSATLAFIKHYHQNHSSLPPKLRLSYSWGAIAQFKNLQDG